MRPQDNIASYEVHTLIGNLRAQASAMRRLSLADIVVHHPISDDYPVEFARTSSLRENSRIVRVCVSMVFFAGLQPDIIYVGGPQDRVLSPMGDYHSRIVLLGYLTGLNPTDVLTSFDSDKLYNQLKYYDQFDLSARELVRRDLNCDIPGAPILMERVIEQPTLFTINHPMNIVFLEIIKATFKKLNLSYRSVVVDYIQPTLAGGPVWPPSAAIHRHHKLRYESSQFLKTDFGGQRFLSIDKFINESFVAYKKAFRTLINTSIVREMLSERNMAPDDVVPYDVRLSPGRDALETSKSGSTPDEEHTFAVARTELKNEALQKLWDCPDNVDVLLEVATQLARAAETVISKDILLELISISGGNLKSRLAAADMLIEVGEEKAVNDQVTRILSENSNRESAEFALTMSRKVGDLKSSIQAALKVIYSSESKAFGYTALAHAVMDARQPGLAISAIDMAIQLEPRNGHHHALRGYALESLRYFQSAVSEYEAAMRLEPTLASFNESLFRVRSKAAS